MFGWSLDDERENPVGTTGGREAAAIHWHWTTEADNSDIASALGVTERTVEKYISSEPSEEVRERMADMRAEVRTVAVAELQSQLQAAGSEAKSAEKPVKVWKDDSGNLRVRDVYNDDGELVDKKPVPADVEIGADSTGRFYRREEVREILDLLTEITGAKAPERMEMDVDADVEHSGEVDVDLEVDDHIVDAVRDSAESNLAGGGGASGDDGGDGE